jgi:hypothetical protein
MRRIWSIGVGTALAVAAAGAWQADPAAAHEAAPGGRQASIGMRAHFDDVLHVHDAIVRGDLDDARGRAQQVAAREFTGVPESAARHLAAMRGAAGRVAAAGDLPEAAKAAGAMLGTCGECHRAVGAMPAVHARPTPPVGETVGHMLAHQRAVEHLLQGLVVPSSTAWNEGAQALRSAPLKRSRLPRDSKLTSEIAAGETRLHELADEAAGTSALPARAAIYGQMVETCSRCHTLHTNIWGPGRR